MHVVDSDFGILGLTYDLLCNKTRVSVCLDGTFRLSSDRFTVLTLGFLGKRRPVKCPNFNQGVATSFFEGIIAIASSESASSYCRLVDSFALAAEKLWEVDVMRPGSEPPTAVVHL